MAEPQHVFDVWLVEAHAVYRAVPFTVVADWLQQGRLVEADRVRAAGTSWQSLGDHPLFAPYLSRPEPLRSDDQAEALEAVELDLPTRRRADAEDDDVDMIPLIDISMVLLVFFMMTAQTAIRFSPIDTPEARYARAVDPSGNLIVSVRLTEQGEVAYFLNDRYSEPAFDFNGLKTEISEKYATARMKPARAIIKASGGVPFEKVIQPLIAALQEAGIQRIQAQVREGSGGS
jgi:biopolymer transport protein ExbD